MALPAYDAAKHHIGLLPAGGGTTFGLLLTGAYSRALQQARMGGLEFGGDRDLIAPGEGMSRWTQDEFVGGQYQYDWGKDSAMFSRSKNMLPSAQSRTVTTVPPLVLYAAFDAQAEASGSGEWRPKSVINFAGSVFASFAHGHVRIYADRRTLWANTYAGGASKRIVEAEYDPADGMIVVLQKGTADSAGSRTAICRMFPDMSTPAQNSRWEMPAGGGRLNASGFQIHSKVFVVGIQRQIWTLDPPEDLDGATSAQAKWTRIGRTPGAWVTAVGFNGLTYILSAATDSKTYLHAFDGTSLLPVCQFPHNFQGQAMCVYAGRIFVGGSGTDTNGAQRYAELYEVTGSSLRQVRSWSRDSYRSGAPAVPPTIRDLCVYEGLLWFHQKGTGLVAYDVTTDGFFGASEPCQADPGEDLYKLIWGREKLYGWGHHLTDSNTRDGLYRICAQQAAMLVTALAGANNDLWFTASTKGQSGNNLRIRYVDPGAPSQALSVSVAGNDVTVNLATNAGSAITSTAIQVRDAVNAHAGASALMGAQIAIGEGFGGNDGTGVVIAMGFSSLHDGGDNVSAFSGEFETSDFWYEPDVDKRWSSLRVLTRFGGTTADFSTDGGASWTALTPAATTTGDFRFTTFDLKDVPISRQVRFRFFFSRGTDLANFTELVAYTCQFALLPETDKRVWTFTILGATEPENIDGAAPSQDINDLDAKLWQWRKEKTKLTFTDLDGTTANVQLVQLQETMPIIGAESGAPVRPEAFYTVTLQEV